MHWFLLGRVIEVCFLFHVLLVFLSEMLKNNTSAAAAGSGSLT